MKLPGEPDPRMARSRPRRRRDATIPVAVSTAASARAAIAGADEPGARGALAWTGGALAAARRRLAGLIDGTAEPVVPLMLVPPKIHRLMLPGGG